ncbi:DUF6118 family protein [Novosphingobium sp. B 225]|uniref:DUF6118 family protein n=1 Tax=Novosphingobium sp. B 225 TaxID=1961849 RepID=UPI000B4BBD30|nr:DUF6118 family protein [Novosphingobium sp. B 225]
MQEDDDGEVELPIEPDDDPDNVVTAQTEAPSDPATEAFTRLEHQLALMRRAVEHLAAERADIVIPDYGATLSGMTSNLAAMDQSLKAIGQMPALQITPEDMGKRIEQTARSARSDYEATIQQWRIAACGLERSVSEAFGSAARRDEQVRRERWFFGAGAALAAALMSFLPGIIARELPESWQLPERMARRTLGEPTIVDAGIRLIRSENPPVWAAISDATATYGANRIAIQQCKDAARKTGRAVRCQVSIDR